MNSISFDKKYPFFVGAALLVLLLTLFQLKSAVEAQFLSFETSEDKTPSGYNEYFIRSDDATQPDHLQLLIDETPMIYGADSSSSPGAASYVSPMMRYDKSSSYGYLVDPQQIQSRDNDGLNDISKLMKLVEEMKLEQEEEEDNQRGIESQFGESISPPVNDPNKFEVYEDLASTSVGNQSAAIMNGLLPLDVDKILNEIRLQLVLAGQQEQNTETSYSTSTEFEPKRESSTSASSYGSSEYIDHPLALIGHQYMQGGAGEGRQLLGPDGTFENVQVVKSDHAVPSYCNPPNPCPIGYTAEDGCLEQFINSASFSREYQAKQQCSCDNEHSLFNCASPITTSEGDNYSQQSNEIGGAVGTLVSPSPSNTEDEDNVLSNSITDSQTSSQSSKSDEHLLKTLARTINNRYGALSSVRNLIMSHETNGGD